MERFEVYPACFAVLGAPMTPQCCPDFACLAGFLGFDFDVISWVKPLHPPFPVTWFQLFPSCRANVPTVYLSYDTPNKYCCNWGPAKQKVFDWIRMSFVLLSKSVPKALSVNGRKQKRKIGVWWQRFTNALRACLRDGVPVALCQALSFTPNGVASKLSLSVALISKPRALMQHRKGNWLTQAHWGWQGSHQAPPGSTKPAVTSWERTREGSWVREDMDSKREDTWDLRARSKADVLKWERERGGEEGGRSRKEGGSGAYGPGNSSSLTVS